MSLKYLQTIPNPSLPKRGTNHPFFLFLPSLLRRGRGWLIIFLLWTPIIHATTMVGKIEDLACPKDFYMLTRQDEPSPLPVRIFTELQTGDMLSLKEGKLSAEAISVSKLPCKPELFTITQNTAHINREAIILTMSLNGQPNRAIKYKELAYRVPEAEETPTIPDNIWRQLSSWFTRQHDEQVEVLVSLHSKAGHPLKPYIKVLEENRQQLLAGKRDLFVAWQYGQPPFSVVLSGNGQKHRYPNLAERQLQAQLTLSPGVYHLAVTDAKQRTVNYDFSAVETQLPQSTSKALHDLTDESLRTIAETMCLAVQNKGVWRFEALQRAAQQAKKDASAEILRDALLRGATISPVDLMAEECRD